VTPWLLILFVLINRCLAGFAGELQETILMEFLAHIWRQSKIPDCI
jgi:hypothetical protein